DLFRIELDSLAHAVEDDEIVAQALHLGKGQAPRHCGREPNSRLNRVTGISPLRENASTLPSRSVTAPLNAYSTGSGGPNVISAVAPAARGARPPGSAGPP